MKNVPVIIGGFYRSGTSLLRRLFDAHSQIHCSPEIKFFNDFYGRYLHDDLNHIRFFTTLRSIGLDEGTLLEIFGKAYIKSHEEAARKFGKRIWADKNPENVLFLEQWQSLLQGQFVFIHVIRHPLDVMASLLEVRFEKTIQTDFKDKVLLYKHFVECGLEFSARYPEQSHEVRYESLISDPESTLKILLDSLGLEYEPVMVTGFNSPQRQEGIEDPKIYSTKTIHTRSIGRWKKDLAPRHIRVVRSLLSELARKLGYELSS